MTLAGLFEGTLTVRISKMTLAELFQGTLMVVIHIMTLAERFEGTLTFGTRKGSLAGLFQGTLMVPKPMLNGAGFRGFYGLSEENFARGLAAMDAAKSLAGEQMLPPENTNTHTYAPTKALIFTLFIPGRGHREGTPWAE